MADPNLKSQFVGNSIFASIAQGYGNDLAPRLTGMLLDENAVNFKQLLSDNSYFDNKASEAYALLAANSQQQNAGGQPNQAAQQ